MTALNIAVKPNFNQHTDNAVKFPTSFQVLPRPGDSIVGYRMTTNKLEGFEFPVLKVVHSSTQIYLVVGEAE